MGSLRARVNMGFIQQLSVVMLMLMLRVRGQEETSESTAFTVRTPSLQLIPPRYGPETDGHQSTDSYATIPALHLQVPFETQHTAFATDDPTPDYDNSYPGVPSIELQLPSLEPYNPTNDPKLHYGSVIFDDAVHTKTPTQIYPKKYKPTIGKKSQVQLERKKYSTIPELDVSTTRILPATDYKPLQKKMFDNFYTHHDSIYSTIEKVPTPVVNPYEIIPQMAEILPIISHIIQNSSESSEFAYKPIEPKPSAASYKAPKKIKNPKLIHKKEKIVTSESNVDDSYRADPRNFGNNEPIQEQSAFAEHHAPVSGAKNDRLQFEMHGHAGPHSYKFGYDTGKGHNRQFRYEERNNDGHVKGHYGYYDKEGKLRVVNYDSAPHEGFRVHPEQEE